MMPTRYMGPGADAGQTKGVSQSPYYRRAGPSWAIFSSMSQVGMGDYSERLNANRHLGGVSHTGEEENRYKQDISALLEQLKQRSSGWDDMWKKLENALVDYASEDSSDKGIRQAVSEQVTVTLDRMQGYWSVLMGGKGSL